jgi:hypothetical protein
VERESLGAAAAEALGLSLGLLCPRSAGTPYCVQYMVIRGRYGNLEEWWQTPRWPRAVWWYDGLAEGTAGGTAKPALVTT